ncbi:MAG TPA: hypothetical protein VF239_14700 [Vicinamibacterales bacterium]
MRSWAWLEADCVRCVPCRKRQDGIAAQRERYKELFHVENRSADDDLEMADCCVALIEAGVFHHRSEEGSQGAGLRPAP